MRGCCAVLGLCAAAAAFAAGDPGTTGTVVAAAGSALTLEQVYEGYEPLFSRINREIMAGNQGAALKDELRFSRQPNYACMGEVAMDAQVQPLVKKANELVTKKEYRKATELYRKVMQEYADDLYPIAAEGVFIPASYYAQRQILAYPKKELAYYRVVYDPVARDIYLRAVKRYSILDYQELARRHLATSYGDDALFALGNAAMDGGRYDEARRRYEGIVNDHGPQDEDSDDITLDRDQVWARLAICHRFLGDESAAAQALSRVAKRGDPAVAQLLAKAQKITHDPLALRQREGRKSARYDTLDDVTLSDPMPYATAANRGEWTAPLGGRGWDLPAARPWISGTDVIYKDMNQLHSLSLLTGKPNWVFGPGGASYDWDRCGRGWASWDPLGLEYDPRQSILVQDGVVLASMFVYGPSLAAVDEYTGRLLWAKGPMAAISEDEWLDRYQAAPAPGRGMIVAPVVHDDIRGLSHLSSSADLAAFETRSGKLLWRTTLARVAPLKITQSRYPRKIRILSTQPIIRDNVIYHISNAGVIGAVDAQTGDIRWLTRYPQKKTVLDNLASPAPVWDNDPPLIRGHRLYVTPVDCDNLLCLDTETGRILWTATNESDSQWKPPHGAPRFPRVRRMAGFTADGLLCLTGTDVVLLNAETGALVWYANLCGWGWLKEGSYANPFMLLPGKTPPKGVTAAINGEGEDFWYPFGWVAATPTLTRDNKLLFSMRSVRDSYPYTGPMNTEFTLDLKTRSVTSLRRWFDVGAFILDSGHAPPVAKRVVNEEPEVFNPAARMTVTRWGVPFEIDVKLDSLVARYDRKKLAEALAQKSDLTTLFARAEMARKQGNVDEAIRIYETCRTLLPTEEDDFRRNINLRLYPLYMTLAQRGYQSGDLDAVEAACKKMGSSASNPSQEIRALLAYAELHERKGRWEQAAGVLQNASRHYWREPFALASLEVGDRQELLATAQTALGKLLAEAPPVFTNVVKDFSAWERAALPDSFLAVAGFAEEQTVETRSLIARRLLELTQRSPPSFRTHYEELAAAEFKGGDGAEVGERLLWCWPGAAASQTKVDELLRKSADGKSAENLGLTWRLEDAAAACGLRRAAPPVVAPAAARPAKGKGWSVREEETGDTDVVRLALPQRGGSAATDHLLFVGGRRKSAYGNRFTVGCWDMQAGKKLWETGAILLHGKTMGDEGSEPGFMEVFVTGDLAVVHGRYDVVAMRWGEGMDMGTAGTKEKKWHFRVPLGFEILSVGMQGPLLVLCGRSGTIALLAESGEIVWDAPEEGEFYAGPFFRNETVLTVRNSPSGVSFRRLGTGRLLSRLNLPGLTTNRKHPIYMGEAGSANPAAAEAAEAYPVAFAEGKLAVIDGRNYHMIDVDRMEEMWSTPTTKVDPAGDPSFRFWLDGGRLFVLKPYYSVLENAVFDVSSGSLIWRRREGGKKIDEKLKGREPAAAAEGAKPTFLLLSSMVFVKGKVYGIRYEMETKSVALVGMDPVTGDEIMRVEEKGYTEPEAYAEVSASEDCVTVRVQDGTRFEVWQVDVAEKKLVQKLVLKGYGRLGEYGEASAVWQGPHLAIWAQERRAFTASGGK
jgi:outer membrane protein assembly factor BamB/tetratricopeptide (TPR) repeat protein